ncbi:MAG: thioredoxin family protein [Inhella sp.]|jgi:thioredoxin-like negative regulator of GroEL|uniref:thioredoxin family protein n=2 Tax=Inhella sp. TaxID=1921806 RepID=UPI0022C258C8|nr:thioredoxin family protein [Inhella sp.]MCZ8235288.1 thioredoxin family protein [Inhella sp.]
MKPMPSLSLLRAAALACALTLGGPAAHAAIDMPPGIAWQAAAADSDIEAAFAKAKGEKKPVLLYWGAKWCPPCNQLKATLFNRADFIAQTQGVVPVMIDGDLPGAQKLGARFKVRGYPTLILFSADGQEVTRLPGEADAPRVVKLLQTGLAGGRPIKDVLTDARQGKSLKAGEWQLLGFYSWDTDEQQLVAAGLRGELLRQLATRKGVPAETRTRLVLKGLAAGAESGEAATPAERATVAAVLKDPKQARAHVDVLSNQAPELVRALYRQAGAERDATVAQLQRALASLQADKSLSRADRTSVLISRVNLARLDEPKASISPKLDAALVSEVRAFATRMDREITDGYERQAVITAAGHLLGQAGLWTESDALLKANLARSHSPYYLMSQLGSNARKTGRNDEALNWYEQAFAKSEGPATRLQWGSTYFKNLIELAPQDSARIEKLVAQLITEAAADKGAFYERSARSLQRVSDQLVPWATGANAPVLARLQTQLGGVCAKLDGTERSTCDGLLKPKKG